MANYSIKTDLQKLNGAFVTDIKGKTATKRCLCIPIEGSGLFLGEKGCYLNMTAIEMQNPQFNDTHCLKVSLDKEIYERLTEEQRAAQPIVGGLHELKRKPQAAVDLTTNQNPSYAATEDDLPF
ncbi:MAG: hypothetical protein HDS59_00235 [Barnesiella sp.]|nr:hypothetical protein [Barnesiella sp.]